jgi:hypothetical protein
MDDHNTEIREHLPVIPTSEWNDIVDKCYERFFSHEARRSARSTPKLNNLLIRLQDFSTVIEANRAMKRGDIGRLINIWKMWSIMTQSLPGLTHYSAYLPRLILLLTHILPPSLSKLIRHSILVSPSGRPNHFVAKDFLLETHNYWLKYFYTRGGIGTQIDRLQALFSSNIPTVRLCKLLHWCHCIKLNGRASKIFITLTLCSYEQCLTLCDWIVGPSTFNRAIKLYCLYVCYSDSTKWLSPTRFFSQPQKPGQLTQLQ